MSTYAHIKRCLDLSDRDIASAVDDRRTAKALLDQMAKVSKPGDGAPKLLLVFAKLASSEADWIDGALRVEMMGDADVTVVEVLSELGLGMHERVFPSFKMGVPLDEFARAVERVPHMIAPLTLSGSTNRRLVLTAVAEDEDEGAVLPAPASVSIDDESLYGDAPRKKSSKSKILAQKPPPVPPSPLRTASSPKHPAVRKVSKPALDAVKSRAAVKSVRPPPAASAPKVVRPSLPRPPALPRTDEPSHSGPPPAPARVVGRVPLARIQVPRGSSVEPAADSSSTKPSKRATVKPPKGQTKPPERRSKSPSPRSATPKSGRGPGRASDAPDSGAIDTGWDEPED
jgi:hypothetical protein